MGSLLRACRSGRARFGAWVVRHPWSGLIVCAVLARAADEAAGTIFSVLFPTRSAALHDAVDRMLPAVFFASGWFLLVVLGLLLAITVHGGAPRRRRSHLLPFSGRHLAVAVLILAGGAGVAFLDGRLACQARHPRERVDVR